MSNEPIFVTRPTLPDLESFNQLLSQIWSTHTLTNCGPLHNRLEADLAKYLGVPYISLFNNGTSALVAALQALDLPKGSEIITTPFSFVATSHSIIWNDCMPVFVDVDGVTCNIDINMVESAITHKTSGILGVHCYGNPCDVDALSKISRKYGVKLLYDAAHAFGVEKDGESILNFGDVSALSFHATKVFSTIEGGAVVSHSLEVKQKIDRLRNFGIQDEVTVSSLGLNGKMSEVHAAYGLLQLQNIDSSIYKRGEIEKVYRSLLNKIPSISLLQYPNNVKSNGSYFPIFISPSAKLNRDEVYAELKKNNIFARRYFYPLITEMEPYKSDPKYRLIHPLNVATQIADQVLCLPIYPDISIEQVELICELLYDWLKDA